MAYTVHRFYNKAIISSSEDLDFNLFVQQKDLSYKLVDTLSIIVSDSIRKEIILDDDKVYKISVKSVSFEDNSGKIEYKLYHFIPFISHLVKDFSKFLCSCSKDYIDDCKSCNSKNDVMKSLYKYNTLTSKLIYLQGLILFASKKEVMNNYHSFIQRAIYTISCRVDKEYEEMIRNECLNGHYDDIKIYKSLVSIHFLGLYFIEKFNQYNLIELDENDNEINYIDEVFNIGKIKDCLCETCLRYQELEEMFLEGVVDEPLPPIDNASPTSSDIFINIESYSDVFDFQFTTNIFQDVYEDVETISPYKVIIVTLPSEGNIEDNLGNLVTVGQEILFTDITSFKYKTTTSEPKINYDSFFFRMNDGELNTGTNIARINLIKKVNNPPNSISDINLDMNYDSTTYIKLSQILDTFVDDENDEITHIKFYYKISDIGKIVHFDLKYLNKNTGNYEDLDFNQEIDITDHNDNDNIIQLKHSFGLETYYRIAAKDNDGSGKYSNDNTFNNVTRLNINVNVKSKVIFGYDYFLSDNTGNDMIVGLGRVEIPFLNIGGATVEVISETGDTIANLSLTNANNSYYNMYTGFGNFDSSNPVSPFQYDIIGTINFNQEVNNYSLKVTTPNNQILTLDTEVKQKRQNNPIKNLAFYKIVTSETNSSNLRNVLDTDEPIIELDAVENFYNSSLGGFIFPTIIYYESRDITTLDLLNTYEFPSFGYIIFGIHGTRDSSNIQIVDNMNNDVTNQFETLEIEQTTNHPYAIYYVSNNVYNNPTFKLKFLNIE